MGRPSSPLLGPPNEEISSFIYLDYDHSTIYFDRLLAVY
jgi:hypothetical protein